jgi:transcription antitermination factor NusG
MYYVGRDELTSDDITKDYIDDFLSWTIKGGASPKTIDVYRDTLRGLLIEAYPDAEGQFRQAFKKSPQRRCAQTRGLNVEQLRTLAKAEFGPREDLTQARDFFMFCVYCGGLDYNAAKSLTKTDIEGEYLTLPTGLRVALNVNIQSVISMYGVADCDEVFPFCRYASEVAYTDKLKEIGERLRMPRIKDHHSEAKAWLSVAKDLQVYAEVMAACAYKRVGAITHYTGTVSADQTKIDDVINSVCNAVADNTEHWYAMKLRDRVTPEQILLLLGENEHTPELRQLKTYYPMEDIKVRVGGKWKSDTKAFIKDVLFFRVKACLLDSLFSAVRNYAWIFRQSNSSISPYAMIPQRDMENFQRAVSQFTDDIAISIVENSDIKVGRKVRLNSGEFAGCEGIIEDEGGDVDTFELRNFYIKFTSNNSFKFRIKVSESSLTVLD